MVFISQALTLTKTLITAVNGYQSLHFNGEFSQALLYK